jgi:hypothetical protein
LTRASQRRCTSNFSFFSSESKSGETIMFSKNTTRSSDQVQNDLMESIANCLPITRFRPSLGNAFVKICHCHSLLKFRGSQDRLPKPRGIENWSVCQFCGCAVALSYPRLYCFFDLTHHQPQFPPSALQKIILLPRHSDQLSCAWTQ